MNLANLWIVFQPNVNTWVPAINERRAHRGPVDLASQQSYTDREFLWIIGRPPDSLAFARSDRSGRDERRVRRFLLFRFCRLFGFLHTRENDRIQELPQLGWLDDPDLAPDDLAVAIDDDRCR